MFESFSKLGYKRAWLVNRQLLIYKNEFQSKIPNIFNINKPIGHCSVYLVNACI